MSVLPIIYLCKYKYYILLYLLLFSFEFEYISFYKFFISFLFDVEKMLMLMRSISVEKWIINLVFIFKCVFLFTIFVIV